MVWVLGTSATLHLQSLFLLTIAKERVSCPAFMNTSACFENYFHLPQFPLQFEDYFSLLLPLLGYSVSGSSFSFSWKETRVAHEGSRKKLPIQTGTKGSCCDASQQTLLRVCEGLQYYRWFYSLQTAHPTTCALSCEHSLPANPLMACSLRFFLGIICLNFFNLWWVCQDFSLMIYYSSYAFYCMKHLLYLLFFCCCYFVGYLCVLK